MPKLGILPNVPNDDDDDDEYFQSPDNENKNIDVKLCKTNTIKTKEVKKHNFGQAKFSYY